MKIFCSFRTALILGIFASIFPSCNNGNNNTAETNAENKNVEFSKEYVVTEHELADAQTLNLVNGQGEQTTYLSYHMQPGLLFRDFKTLELVPTYVVKRPDLEVRDDGKMLIHYEIRPEAKWDNGEPITAKDMDFSLKVIKNPKVDCQRVRPYFEFIESIEYSDDNPRKFTLVCKEAYMLAEQASGDFNVLPRYIYDPKGLMDEFSLKDLSDHPEDLAENPKIIEFANDFNSEKYSREVVAGGGPYELEKWETNQRIILKRKKNWWGDAFAGANTFFDKPRPEKIIFETINDEATAITALKAQKIDVMRSIDPKTFVKDLPNSEKFNTYFNTFTPPMMAYEYIGLNLKDPKFEDVNTRIALAHLVDVDKIIKTIYYGLGARTIGNIHPSNKKFYNDTITPYDYNVEKAKAYLAKAGWKDSDGDGVLDKMINGKKVDFQFKIDYNNGNPRREKVALIFQEEARKVGIKVEPTPLEWSVYLERAKKHEFEAYIAGWISGVGESDPKQIWHTESYNGGSNYVGFGNAETDALIDSLRKELDVNKRAEYYKKFQVILHEQVPYIFLNISKQRIAIHKRFANAYGSPIRPGYWMGGFTLAQVQTQ